MVDSDYESDSSRGSNASGSSSSHSGSSSGSSSSGSSRRRKINLVVLLEMSVKKVFVVDHNGSRLR